ncbi:S-layer homology domain-containing protein, partial [Oscillospiraceae bacterium 44-5]
VMVGDERGFGPERPVNRAEMAVVMGKLLSLDYNYYEAVCPFDDVYDWARGWVGACAANGIVSGRGDGIYDPGSTVTAVEAASMLMRALGYFKYSNDYANGFEVSTVTQGTKIGIFKGVGSSATEPMTRNQVAQMVLNALQSDVVEPDGNTINLTTPDGTVLTGKVNYVSVTRDEAFATAIDDTRATSVGSNNDGWIVELGERLYNGDLKLYSNSSDDFMRPSRTWEYKGKEVGTYMKKENIRAEYTVGVNRRTLYDLLGRNNLQDYDFHYYVDGVERSDITPENIVTRSTSNYSTTGRGVLTQVFVDLEKETIDITSINTFLAKATADYSATTESVNLEVYSFVTTTSGTPDTIKTDSVTKTVNVADVPEIEGLKEDQYVLVNVTGRNTNPKPIAVSEANKTLNGYNVVVVSEPEILADSTLTKYSKASDSDTSSNTNQAFFTSVVSGGTEYKNSKRAYYSDEVLELYADDRLVNKTYNIYLDKYGYAIGIDLFSGDDNYVFITGFDPSGSHITLGSAKAAAIFTDGTMKTINVNVKDTDKNIRKVTSNYFVEWNTLSEHWQKAALNRWYTYTVDAAGDYTLSPATRMFVTEVSSYVGDNDYNQVIKCNSVRIDENATTAKISSDNVDGAAAGQTTGRAWGNDDSIFIVVEADDIADESTGKNVINDVAGVYTGVQDVEIEVNTNKKVTGTGAAIGAATNYGHPVFVAGSTGNPLGETLLYDQIYTLYDKDNFIIASVILGEAKGSNANYAYILSAATSEEQLADGGTVYTFDAVVDGKVTSLKTNSKFEKVISDLEPGHVQELRYTGDYVTGVKTPENGATPVYYTGWNAFEGVTGVSANPKKITDETIYDVGHSYAGLSAGSNSCAFGSTLHTNTVRNSFSRLTADVATNLKVDGRTMYLSRPENGVPVGTLGADYGLTFVENAPAVVIQTVDGEGKKINCNSVAEAINELADPNTDTSAKEFKGRIVAVLDSTGVAKWVVFISDTPKFTAPAAALDPRSASMYLTGDLTGIQSLPGLTVATGLQSVRGGSVYTLNLKPGYTATATYTGVGGGSLILTPNTNTWTITAPGNGGAMTVNVSKVIGTVNMGSTASVTDVNAALFNGNNVVVAGPWVPSDSNTELRIPDGRTLTVNGSFDAQAKNVNITASGVDKTGKLVVSGTLNMNPNDDIDFELLAYNLNFRAGASTSISISKPLTVQNDMVVFSTVSTNITIPAGVRVDVGNSLKKTDSAQKTITIYGSLYVAEDRKTAADAVDGFILDNQAPSTLVVGGTIKNSTVKTGSAAATALTTLNNVASSCTIEMVKGTLTVTGKMDASTIKANAGTQITFASTASVGTNAASSFVDANNNNAGTVAGLTFTAPTGATVETETALTNGSEAAKGEPISAQVYFVHDAASWGVLRAAGCKNPDKDWNAIDAHGFETMPWIYVLAKKTSAEDTVKVVGVEVKVNGTKVQTLAGGQVDNEWNWDATENGGFFHWEMQKSTDTSANTLTLDQTAAAQGTYEVIFTVQVGSETTNTVKVSASGNYTGPASVTPPTTVEGA